MRLGNNMITSILGRDTILLKCKTGDQKLLADVYLILWLTANIVSLGQLEEDGHKIMIHAGFLSIWD
jgi:hypothetical protein